MSQRPSQSISGLQQVPDRFSFDAILDFGRAALDPGGVPFIRSITLRQMKGYCNSSNNESFSFKANDLCKSLASGVYFITPGAILTSAILDFLFIRYDRPHRALLCAPDKVKAYYPEDLPRILAWLRRSRLCLQHQVGGVMVVLFLALVAAVMAATPDDAPDDDDLTFERHSLRA